MSTVTLDCANLNCPLPILRLSKAINIAASGATIEMVATDPGSVKDVEAWARQTGHNLMESRQEGGRFTFVVRKN
jgi:tRNA 2-thiouridine synthesizing protein A